MHQPNILFIMSDEHRASTFGFMGEPVHTPCFDAFSRESLVFERAFCVSPVCAPSRATLWTGMHPWRNGVAKNGEAIFDDAITFGEALQSAGYATGMIGKWHLGGAYEERGGSRGRAGDPQRTPKHRRRGWDYWYANECFNDMFHWRYYENDALEPISGYGWQPDHETDVAIDFLHRHAADDKPFALVVSWNPPHHGGQFHRPDGSVIQLPPDACQIYAPDPNRAHYEHIERLDRPNYRDQWDWAAHDGPQRYQSNAMLPGYLGAVESLDANFGRLLDTLHALDIEQDTIVIFTSDHGDQLGSHGLATKGFWYDESACVPLMMRWPGHISARRDEAIFSQLHLMPTLLGFCGVPVPNACDGYDQSSFFLSQETPRPLETAFISYSSTLRRTGKGTSEWLFIPFASPDRNAADHEWRMLRTRDHALIIEHAMRPDNSGRDLFDLHFFNMQDDPYQLNPLPALDDSGKALEQDLLAYLDTLGDPFANWVKASRSGHDWLRDMTG